MTTTAAHAVHDAVDAYPQPAWEVRVRDGVIELKR